MVRVKNSKATLELAGTALRGGLGVWVFSQRRRALPLVFKVVFVTEKVSSAPTRFSMARPVLWLACGVLIYLESFSLSVNMTLLGHT